MIDKIKNYQNITTENEVFSPQSWKEYLDKKWIDKTTSKDEKKVISLVRWEYRNKVFSLALKVENAIPDLLPDLSGLLAIEHTDNLFADELVIYDDNLTERFRIKPPVVSEWSKPDNAYFYYVKFNKNNGQCECLFNDGHDEYVGLLDLLTGSLTNVKKTRI